MTYQSVAKRTAQTLPVIAKHAPALQVGDVDAAKLAALAAGLPGLAKAREDLAQKEAEAARALATDAKAVRVLTLKVPSLIEGYLDEDDPVLASLARVFTVVPSSRALTTKRARLLIPVWEAADAALAALGEPPIVRRGVGVAEFRALLAAQPGIERAAIAAKAAADKARKTLAAAVLVVDKLNKRFYGALVGLSDPGSPLEEAISKIET